MTSSTEPNSFRTISWIGDVDGYVRILDQTRLPAALEYRDCRSVEDIHEAICSLRVRGAPAIGIAAAMGVVLGIQSCSDPNPGMFEERLHEVIDYLRSSRPTAINLFHALQRMERRVQGLSLPFAPRQLARLLLEEAKSIEEDDRTMCRCIGDHGSGLIQNDTAILTHCNAGALATADYGTALGVFYRALERHRRFKVFVTETRPLLQGARLTAWELQQRGIDVTLICDIMAGTLMKEGKIQLVLVGADRIAANGDAANKIGTYSLAVLAHAHQIPFYVAAPSSSFDLDIDSGDDIPIEERDPSEITHPFGTQTAPDNIHVYNPAFDVTPARLITGIVTDRGLIQPVNEAVIRKTITIKFHR